MKFKKILSVALASALFTASLSPTYAEAPAQPVMDISPWAINVLNEGERYGIYPIEWYYQDFRAAISKERLNQILDNTAAKLAELKLAKNNQFKAAKVVNAYNREGVLTALYNLIGQYKLEGAMAINGQSPVAYMTKQQVVVGDKSGLQLERPCTSEQAVIFATKLVEKLYNHQGAGSEGLLWKASKGTTTVYMLGAIHIADASLYPMDKTLLEHFNASSALLVEANLFDQNDGMAYMQSQSVYSDGKSLKDALSASTYEAVQKAFAKFGIPEATYSKLKPWTAANTLTVLQMSNADEASDASTAANAGIDMYFLTKALLSGKPIIELEGLKFQTDLFNNMTPQLQERNLLDTAKAVNSTATTENKEADLLDSWLALWKAGDELGFKQAFNAGSEDANNEYTKALFGERDKAMAEKIAKLLNQNDGKTYFVVVGAGHLALDTSVVELLKKQGFQVEAVN